MIGLPSLLGGKMATTSLFPLHAGKGRTVGNAISDIIDYVKNPDKTDNGRMITSWECDSRIADAQFLYTKQEYIRRTGRVRGADDVIAYHLRQSFLPGEITPEEANRLGQELASRFTKGNHAYIVCTHIDKKHIHNHIIWNSTDLEADRKFNNFWGSTKAIRRLNDTICIENGYSIVENPRKHGQSYNKWLGNKKPCYRERIRADIDAALGKHPDSFEELLRLLEASGYQIKYGKVPSLLGSEQKRFIRMDSLGEEYLPTVIKAVIVGERKHIPRQRKRAIEIGRSSASLLVDIQSKLQEGKGEGYVRWAKSFNLKQAAQTLIYLQENKLLEYTDLDKRTQAVTDRYHELATEIKSAEGRMAEIKTLQQQIINYSKTRGTYIAYRKAGYSPKFREEHEADIILHQSAKKYFDTLGIEKLPTVKSLQSEYSELLERKKKIYPEYRKKQSEMKELLTIKANVDRLLNMDIQPNREEQHEKHI